jgi:hypothetical protein
MMLNTDAAWLAGLIDGEGYVGTAQKAGAKNGETARPSVAIGMTSPKLVEWVLEHCPEAGIYQRKNKGANNKAITYIVVWRSDKAVALLKQVRSYLIIKREQADLVIQCQLFEDQYYLKSGTTYRWNGPTPQPIKEFRHDTWTKLRILNKKGPPIKEVTMSFYKTPFSDAISPDAVPHKGTGPGEYDSTEVPNTPSRTGGMFPELHRDKHFSEPKLSGPYSKSPFKDAVD